MRKPSEIIVHEKVTNDPVTIFVKEQCPDTPIKVCQ